MHEERGGGKAAWRKRHWREKTELTHQAEGTPGCANHTCESLGERKAQQRGKRAVAGGHSLHTEEWTTVT